MNWYLRIYITVFMNWNLMIYITLYMMWYLIIYIILYLPCSMNKSIYMVINKQ